MNLNCRISKMKGAHDGGNISNFLKASSALSHPLDSLNFPNLFVVTAMAVDGYLLNARREPETRKF